MSNPSTVPPNPSDLARVAVVSQNGRSRGRSAKMARIFFPFDN